MSDETRAKRMRIPVGRGLIIWRHFRAALFCLALSASVQLAHADATEDLNKAVDAANAAQSDAQANAPNQVTVKGREDALDRAIRNNEDVQANPDAAQWQKDDAQAAQDTAQQQADGARSMARDPNQAQRYRDALKRRREARKALLDVKNRLHGMLGGAVNRKEIEILINRALRLLNTLDAPIPAPPATPQLSSLLSGGQVEVAFAGTGETIGHIADLQIKNLTDKPISLFVPPAILESSSGKNQHYACPRGQMVAIKPHDSITVPMDGVCLVRNKPPVGKGEKGDLLVNDGRVATSERGKSHVPADQARHFLSVAKSKYDAAEKLEHDGALKGLPYRDKKKQKDIVVQWSTWMDPEITELTGAPPATKEDLKKVVYKQLEEQGPITPDKKKKVDEGINTIFEKIELTSAKAKELEVSNPFTQVELTGEEAKGDNGEQSESKPPAPSQPPSL